MPYVVQSTEGLRQSASEMETKALLYLMTCRDDSDDIYYFIVDFFNDLTGADRMAGRLWDVQSKGASGSSPKAIGKELVTLFKNFLSDFEFSFFILFLGGVSGSVRIDNTKTCFPISNIREVAVKKIVEGLKEESYEKIYIDNNSITDDNITAFLQKVYFVIDDKTKEEYIKSIIRINPMIMPDDLVFVGIFNEIRNKQASKKNESRIEGRILNYPREAIHYCRHLTKSEIKLLVLNRIINWNVIGRGVPLSFIPIYNQFPPQEQRDRLEDCYLGLSKALFNRNHSDDFWALFENIYGAIVTYPSYSVEQIFENLDQQLVNRCYDFDVLSLEYFIAI